MLSNFALWFILLGKLEVFFTFIAVSTMVSAVVLIAACTVNYIEWKSGHFERNEKYFKMLIKPTKIVCVIALISLLIIIFIPSQTDTLLYTSMKTIDNYSIDNPESMLNADSVLSVVDKTFHKINDLLSPSE